jgi:hypothetical protein
MEEHTKEKTLRGREEAVTCEEAFAADVFS